MMGVWAIRGLEQAPDVADREDQYERQQDQHAIAVDELLDDRIRAPARDGLVTQERDASAIERGERQQVEEAEQRADERRRHQERNGTGVDRMSHVADDAHGALHVGLEPKGDQQPQRTKLQRALFEGRADGSDERRAQSSSLARRLATDVGDSERRLRVGGETRRELDGPAGARHDDGELTPASLIESGPDIETLLLWIDRGAPDPDEFVAGLEPSSFGW